jgi:hypothetical protein
MSSVRALWRVADHDLEIGSGQFGLGVHRDRRTEVFISAAPSSSATKPSAKSLKNYLRYSGTA